MSTKRETIRVYDGRIRSAAGVNQPLTSALRVRVSETSGRPYFERITISIEPPQNGSVRHFKPYRRRSGFGIDFVDHSTLIHFRNEPLYTGEELQMATPDEVPFAPPPKFGPDVIGMEEWVKQMDAHRRWLDYFENRKPEGGEGGDGTTSAKGEQKPANEQGGGENSNEQSNDSEGERSNSSDSEDKSMNTGRYNVYAKAPNGKEARVGQNIEAETITEAIKQAKQVLGAEAKNYTDYRAARQRGAAFGQGSDARRRNDPARGGSQGSGSQGSGEGEQGEGEQQQQQSGQQGQGGQQSQPKNGDVVLTRLNATPLIGSAADKYMADVAAKQLKPVVEEAFRKVQQMDAQRQQQPQGVNEQAVAAICQKIVGEAMKAMSVTTTIQMVQPNGEVKTIEEHTHPLFAEVMRLILKGKPVYLWGPSGSGKTHLAAQIARALHPDASRSDGIAEHKFYAISVTMGTSESHLQGWRLPLDAGKFVYVSSEFVRIFEHGGLFLLDEADKADPNVLSVLNQALANKRLPIPTRFENPVAEMHKDFRIIAAGNTSGQGSDRLYSAAVRLDEAFLDRFRVGTMRMDYDTSLEQKLVGKTRLLKALWAVRKEVDRLKLERVVSTRSIIEFHEVFGGTTPQETAAALTRLFEPWPEQERMKFNVKTLSETN